MRKRVEKALRSWDEADEVLRKIGFLDRQLSRIENLQNIQIERAKERAKADAEVALKDKKVLELQLEQFCESRKDEFKTVRSKKLTFGTVSFRQSSRVLIKSVGKTLAALKDLGWLACIRTKEEPDKEALKALGADKLTLVGCKLKTDDAFGYEVDQTKIVETDAA